jgi:hypothetical protein
MSEKMKTTLKILWIASGIIIFTTMIVAGFLSYRASEAILQRKSVALPEWEFKWMLGSMIALVVWGLLRLGYEYRFEREKWLQRHRERMRLPRIYWIVGGGVWLALIVVRHFSSLSSPSAFLMAVLWLFIGIAQGYWYWRNRNQAQWKFYLTVLFFVVLAGWQFTLALDEVNQDLRTCVGRTYFQRTEVKSFGCDILRKIRPRFTYTTSNPVPNTRVTCEGRECWKTENGVVVACGPNWNCMDDPNFDLFTRRPASNPVVNSVGPSPPSPSGR